MQEVTGAHVFQLGRLILVGGADRVDLCLECKPSLGPNLSYMSHPLIIVYLVSPCVYEEVKNKTKQRLQINFAYLYIFDILYKPNAPRAVWDPLGRCAYLAAGSVQPFFRLKEFTLVWIPIT